MIGNLDNIVSEEFSANGGRVFCFGELLLRLSPPLDEDWIANHNMPVYVGGAELNVAVALAQWQIPVSYGTALPDNFISKQIMDNLKKKKIDISALKLTGERVGVYYLPAGTDLKNTGVIYDRSGSAFSTLTPGSIDWDKVFAGVHWFHLSAICPAVNQQIADLCYEALKVATEKKIFVSIDLNYRSKLWKYGKDASQVIPALVDYCDLVMGNPWAANTMLNIPVDERLHEKNKKAGYIDQAKKTSIAILEKFPKCKAVANTFRFDRLENGIYYYATLFINDILYCSQEFSADSIVDRVGSGDCFMAGLIYGFYKDLPPKEIIDFAAAAAFSKLFIMGDSIDLGVDEIKSQLILHE